MVQRRGWIGLAALVAALALPGAAAADSLVYVKAGNVWIANADGSNAYQVTLDGTAAYPYASPSQADDGTIVAVRATATTRRQLYRMRQNGELLNPPIDTPAPGTGALDARVSPDGRLVAYWFTTTVFDPTCVFCVNVANRALLSYSDRFTAHDAIGTPNTGGWPSWIGNDTIAITNGSATVYYYRLGMPEAAEWFADFQTGGGSPIPTLLDVEASRDGARLAVVRGNNQETVTLYALNGPPPALPSPFTANCALQGPAGKFSDPTWSENGQALAAQDGAGIWVLALPTLTPPCAAPVLVVPGGSEPDFGPAAVNPGPRPACGNPGNPVACGGGGGARRWRGRRRGRRRGHEAAEHDPRQQADQAQPQPAADVHLPLQRGRLDLPLQGRPARLDPLPLAVPPRHPRRPARVQGARGRRRPQRRPDAGELRVAATAPLAALGDSSGPASCQSAGP